MVELFKLGAAEFAAEAELMLAYGVGDDVGEMAGDIFAALRRRLADAIKAGDGNVWERLSIRWRRNWEKDLARMRRPGIHGFRH
jgi:hypothetical protein